MGTVTVISEGTAVIVLEQDVVARIDQNRPIVEIGNQGIQGPPGDVGNSLPATNVTYDFPGFPTVEAALNSLLYVHPQITSFTNSVGTVEIGQTITAVNLAWAINKAVTGQTLTDATPAPTDRTASITGLNLTSTTAFNLTATDGSNTASASTSVVFELKRYFGVSSNTNLNNAQILALSSEFATNFDKAVTYNCTGGAYPFFAYPSSFGTPSNVTVGGLAFSAYTLTVQAVTNASGHTENYNVIRFNLLQTGASIQVVWQ